MCVSDSDFSFFISFFDILGRLSPFSAVQSVVLGNEMHQILGEIW
jgi:hypothetical protein